MTAILVLLAALAGGNQQCQEAISLQQCDALLADGIPPAHDLGHIAVVKPPSQRKMEAKPSPAPAPTPMPAAAADPEPQSQPEPVALAAPAPQPEPKPMPEKAIAEPEVSDGWFVQIAAFSDREAAQEGARRIGREDIQVLPTRRDGQDWFVLLLGTYDSREEADGAGRDYAQDTGEGFWVREASTLKALELTPE